MKNQVSTNQLNQSENYRKSAQVEMQRRFVNLQFRRSELENQLRRVNEVLSCLSKEIDELCKYD